MFLWDVTESVVKDNAINASQRPPQFQISDGFEEKTPHMTANNS